MQSITITTQEYTELLTRLDGLDKKLSENGQGMQDRWIDNQEFMLLMKISRRTAQTYRDENMIAFSIIGNKLYYKMTDVEDLLNRHYKKRLV
jgi:hypothetical protein